MTKACAPEAFLEKFFDVRSTFEKLKALFQTVPVELRAGALLEVFADQSRPDDAFHNQTRAGQLLIECLPPCGASLHDVLTKIAPSWNASVEELPFYLDRVFGRAHVVATARKLAQEMGAKSRERAALETIVYWLT
jgi:hypothetical protein